jgi:hypothetical protein
MVARYPWVHRVGALKRQATGNAIQASSNPLEAGTPGHAAQTLNATAPANTSLYLGVGIGVGGALLIACALIIVKIVRKRAEHKRALAELEHGHTVEVAQVRNARGDVFRPVSFARVGRLVPAHGKGGWGALGSNEEVNEPDLANHPARKRRSYISIPKRFKQQGVPLRRLKHLSAIIESPRSRSAHSPTPDQQDLPVLPLSKSKTRGTPASTKTTHGEALQGDDVFAGPPSSPKPTVLPSFAIRSPGRYGVSFVEDSPNKAKRSYSVGALIAPIPDGAVFGSVANNGRHSMHARSVSLGAHKAASQPPTGPVPPLPVIAPHNPHAVSVRNGFCLSRMSSSSQESASSSVLVTSPILRAPDVNSQSPSLEQIVADDDSASLKQVSHRQWQNPLVAGPRPIPDTSPTVPALTMSHRHKPSVRSNVARYSVDSQLSRQLSTTSVASSTASEKHNRLSIPRFGTADRVSIRSVSSVGSFKHDSGVKKITTPRRVSRCSTTVSENGSPAEKPKGSVLRDISGNAGPPTRQASNATQTSSRSSNGNPFQWDSVPLQKPSALKGSPNARKGHRRQNCVRISTLTPQILGPPPSRPTSPSIMHGIEEEPLGYDGSSNTMGGLPFVSNSTHLSRPSSLTAFAPNLRISTLRASLTSSSPTLSSWTTFQNPVNASQPADAMSSRSASPCTAVARSAYRQSGQSSNFSIPSFPSPSKTTVTAVQRDQPVPEFYFTRPSTDEPGFDFGWERDDHSPIDVHIPNDDITSSPPLPVAKEDEYDPTCPMLVIPKREGAQEYDPASPEFAVPVAEPDKSSPFASTVTFSDDDTRYSRPVSYSEEYQPESPPCSPKTMPQTFCLSSPSSTEDHSTSSTPRGSSPCYEKLTSANASTIMARIRTHSHKVDFPGAPILPPPIDDNPVPFPLTTSRNRSISTAGYLQPHRPAPPPPLPLDDKGDVPIALIPGPRPQYSPTLSDSRRTSASPCGPRDKPAKSVAKQIIALRRMNSEMDTSTSNQSRRYLHGLSREPAPLLPWIGSPEPSESCNDMFDFDFGSTGGYDARGGADDGEDSEADPTSALDDVDLTDIERRLEGALAGFDIPPPSVDEAASEKEASSPISLPEQTDECEDRASSVWEDGEKFWNRTSLSTIPGSSPSDAEKARTVPTPRMFSAGYGLGSRRSNMRPPSVMATPKSLYDAEGFLRT